MRLLLIWREGALAYMKHGNFGMTPYGPPPKDFYNNYNPEKGSAWARGFWWAKKHRPRAAVNGDGCP